jgi:hypothetical protein
MNEEFFFDEALESERLRWEKDQWAMADEDRDRHSD